jgi:hypothetical protein
MNFWSDTEAVYKSGVVTLFMKDVFDLSSLCPQQCLFNHIPDSEGQEGQEPTTPTKTVGPSREEASSSKKVPINNRFNPVPSRSTRLPVGFSLGACAVHPVCQLGCSLALAHGRVHKG